MGSIKKKYGNKSGKKCTQMDTTQVQETNLVLFARKNETT
jgi:hypothetical protein